MIDFEHPQPGVGVAVREGAQAGTEDHQLPGASGHGGGEHSGTHRTDAHCFYLRERMAIVAFRFSEPLA
ncbi:hypothetical protein [Streptomyces sp. NPDC037389]|uniref:hypothetical protein n=1 Tax=Streptomyces sp. NPDC037389 TaxID=3155369 RepID=UPI0033CB0359